MDKINSNNRQTTDNVNQYSNSINQFTDSSKNSLRIARGYRLKVSTHNLIKNLSDMTGMDSDTLITQACLLLNKKIIEEKEINFKNDIEDKL